jgi:hypothetical protein
MGKKCKQRGTDFNVQFPHTSPFCLVLTLLFAFPAFPPFPPTGMGSREAGNVCHKTNNLTSTSHAHIENKNLRTIGNNYRYMNTILLHLFILHAKTSQAHTENQELGNNRK